VAAGNPLGRRKTVTLGDLEAELNFSLQCPELPTDQLLDLVALGQLIMVGGRSTADRIDSSIRAVPVVDLPDSLVLLAWPDGALTSAAADFVGCAKPPMPAQVQTARLRSAG
jgi:hypothetical protein